MILMAQYKGYFQSENQKSKEFSDKVYFVNQRIKEVTK